MGVQYSLWGGSVMNLGTERHKKQYYDAIDKFKIPGERLLHMHKNHTRDSVLPHYACMPGLACISLTTLLPVQVVSA